jgi:threonine dehydratase
MPLVVALKLEAVRPTLDAIRSAQERLRALALRSPLVLPPGGPAGVHVALKLESLQCVGSFKLRPVGNAVLGRSRACRR